MNKKKTIILGIFLVLAIIISGLLTSYALFSVNVTKNKNFRVAVGTFELTLTDSNNTFTDGKIVASNLVPMRDSEGITQDGYNFTLTNSGSIDAAYKLYLDDVVLASLPENITGRLDNSVVRVKITNITTNISNTYTLSEIPDRLLETGTLEAGSSNTYNIKMWLAYTAGNESQNKYFAVNIRIEAIQDNLRHIAGLYDNNGNLVATWDTLVNKYGLDVEKDYDFDVDEQNNISSDDYIFENGGITALNPSSFKYIVAHNQELSTGSKLVIGNVSKIGSVALIGTSLKEIEIPSSVISIGQASIIYNPLLTTVNIPSEVEIIPYGSFWNNSSLTNINFASNGKLAVIGDGAFGECDFRSITIPASVTTIGSDAFSKNYYLATVSLEANSQLATIGERAFYATAWYDTESLNGPVTLNGITVN